MKKRVLFGFIFIIILFFGNGFVEAKESVCGDGTLEGTCSLTKGYFCEEGKLVEKSSICGCSEVLVGEGEACVSKYQTEPKEIVLKYFFEGKARELNFTVYEGMKNYVSELDKTLSYSNGEEPSRGDFKLKSMDEEEQRELLLPLVVEIQNLEKKKEDQFRIATSIVQSIPYVYSGKITSFFGIELNYSRYPYEVLYENEGICGEKTQLLSFLLRELGYGVSLIYYDLENHEAVGVNCPEKRGLKGTGVCLVETTARSIVNDRSLVYVGGITLESEPEIFPLSEGISLPRRTKEYRDARTIEKLRNSRFVLLREWRLNRLNERYGLGDVREYNLE